MNITTIELQDAQSRFAELVRLVLAGNEVVLTQQQTPLIRLSSILPLPTSQHEPLPRVAGLHAGMTWVSDDFDEPIPDAFWLGEE